MASDPSDTHESADGIADLRARLEEAEATLEAIRSGSVDALVRDAGGGYEVYTLQGADYAYRVVLDKMSEGVLTLTSDGTIVYCNQRLSDMLGIASAAIIGRPFADILPCDAAERSGGLLARACLTPEVTECDLLAPDGTPIPTRQSVTAFTVDHGVMFSVLVSDLTEAKRQERVLLEHQSNLRALVSQLTTAEQRERRVIAGTLHDSLVQTLAFCRIKLGMSRQAAAGQPVEAGLIELDALLRQAVTEARSLTSSSARRCFTVRGWRLHWSGWPRRWPGSMATRWSCARPATCTNSTKRRA
jgi:PAS domain S-box-containing protein